jgi:hypothetical protein
MRAKLGSKGKEDIWRPMDVIYPLLSKAPNVCN